jgi:hypothetical protein
MYMQARLTPWAEARITRDYGRVSKKSIKQSLADFPGTEFHTIASPAQRGGAVFTLGELDSDVTGVEVRYNRDLDLVMLKHRADGTWGVL